MAGVGSRHLFGSIPARAGEPGPARFCHPGNRVYPRACGGTAFSRNWAMSAGGLSPRVRGNRAHCGPREPQARSIPARAGEPFWRALRAEPEAVYPRACGGTYGRPVGNCLAQGLSPRVRGNLIGLALSQTRMGSIPARAGEPDTGKGKRGPSRVYPRACGGTGAE